MTTRGEGQLEQASVHIVGLKIAKRFKFGNARQVEVAGNVYNLFNGGNFLEFNRSGANRIYSPSTYGTGTTLQEARAYQINVVFRFKGNRLFKFNESLKMNEATISEPGRFTRKNN